MDNEVEIEISTDNESEEVPKEQQRAETAVAGSSDDAEELRGRWLRTAAELDNLHKRMAKRIDHVAREERRTVLGAFLTVVDSLERALAVEDATASSWAEGVAGIHRQIVSVLKRFGAEPIEALGKPFDPNKHEAMAVVPHEDHLENTVIEVAEVGYELNDGTLLRPAKVVVARRGGSRTE
jgi:molecular chaperone GrpE